MKTQNSRIDVAGLRRRSAFPASASLLPLVDAPPPPRAVRVPLEESHLDRQADRLMPEKQQ